MSEPVDASVVRLAVTTVSAPQCPPLDVETGQFPSIVKGADTAFQVGVFNAAGFPISLANLSALVLKIFPYVPPQNYLGYPLDEAVDPIAVVTVDAEDLTELITRGNWDAGLAQNATFILSSADSSNFDLQGQPYDKFTISLTGIKSTGSGRIAYASGPLFVYESYDAYVELEDRLGVTLLDRNGTILLQRPT